MTTLLWMGVIQLDDLKANYSTGVLRNLTTDRVLPVHIRTYSKNSWISTPTMTAIMLMVKVPLRCQILHMARHDVMRFSNVLIANHGVTDI